MKAAKTLSGLGSIGMMLIYGALGVMILSSLASLVFLVVVCTC